VRPDKPYDVAAWALSALRDAEPCGRNPTVVPDHGRESGEEAYSKANPPSVDGGVWVDDDARGGQSQGPPPPQVSTALFGSSEVFGSTVGKTQGKTGQRGSAADFFPGTAAGVPRGHQFEKEAEAHGVPTALFGSSEVFASAVGKTQGKTRQRGSADQFEKEAKAHGVPTRGFQIYKEAGAHDVCGSDGESDEDSAPFEWLVEADRKAMLALADNRSFRGTSASRMAADTRAAEAAPGWTGVGADYAA
jgi:hypothetical protein